MFVMMCFLQKIGAPHHRRHITNRGRGYAVRCFSFFPFFFVYEIDQLVFLFLFTPSRFPSIILYAAFFFLYSQSSKYSKVQYLVVFSLVFLPSQILPGILTVMLGVMHLDLVERYLAYKQTG